MEAFIPNGFSIFVIAIVILAIVMIRSGIKQVPQAQEWTVERFGKYTHTMRPGLNLIIPFIDKVGFKLSLRETVLDIPPQDVISYDNATITADGVAFYQIVDPAKTAYEVRDLERALTNLSLTNLRTVIGSMSLDDVLSKRDVINERLLRVIDEASNSWGIKVNRVEIKDLSPPDVGTGPARLHDGPEDAPSHAAASHQQAAQAEQALPDEGQPHPRLLACGESPLAQRSQERTLTGGCTRLLLRNHPRQREEPPDVLREGMVPSSNAAATRRCRLRALMPSS